MRDIYLGLGSNMGDRQQLMLQAVEYLCGTGAFTGVRVSSLYETEPMGFTDQAPFLNAVFRGSTDLAPMALLEVCRQVEAHLDRVRVIHWGPRTIDADVLLYGTDDVELPELTVPHPRMFERNFVLIPLMEVCSAEVSAYYNLPQRSAELADQGIRRLEPNETTAEWYTAHHRP